MPNLDAIHPMTSKVLAQAIDHTLLRKDAAKEQIQRLCQEAVEFGFKTVCVEARWLPEVCALLKGTEVLPITVVGFPSGLETTSAKKEETRQAVDAGAREIDMVLNRQELHQKNYSQVLFDIQEVVREAGPIPVKVILETSDLSEQEKVAACVLAKVAGAAFVKTSTGFSASGATEADVRLMRQVVGDRVGVKASGGVKTLADAIKLIQAGADRLGASASVSIVQEGAHAFSS